MGRRAFAMAACGFLGVANGCVADDTAVGPLDAATDVTVEPKDAASDATLDALDGSVLDASIDVAADAAPHDAATDARLDASDASPVGEGCDPASYPSGPYGAAVGDVIANLAFQGLVDANGNGHVDDDPPVTICLGRYHAASAPKLLVVHWIASWSAACQAEAPAWVALAAQNAGKARVLEAMAENVSGRPASISTIQGWSAKYGVASDMAVDPSQLLAPLFVAPPPNGAPWPAHALVRTDTMKIVSVRVGADDAGDVQSEIDQALASDAGGP